MSFAPKSKAAPGQTRNKKDASEHSYRKSVEDGKDDASRNSERDLDNSRQNASRRSERDTNVVDRIMNMEKDISAIQLQQDSYRQLLALKDTVDIIQNDNKLLHSLVKRTSRLEDRLDEFANRFDEYQHKTEQFLVVVDKNIDEESTLREEENKKLKKVCAELERRQKEMDYEIKKDIKNTQIKAKEELLTVASDIDKKADAHKEFLENHINAVHRALKSTLADDEDRLNDLNSKLDNIDSKFDSKITKLDDIVMPNFDVANKRRKIDYTDLKSWLLDSIDERFRVKEKKLEGTVKKNYNSTMVQQKTEISDLKREVNHLAETSPQLKSNRNSTLRQSNVRNSHIRNSNVRDSEVYDDEVIEDYEAAEDVKSQASSTENQLMDTIKELKQSINAVEKYTLSSGDDIGNKLDQYKISIYDWNDKIIKNVKKFDKLKGKNRKTITPEVRSTSQALIDEFATFEDNLKQDISFAKDLINDRKDKLVTDTEVVEQKLTQAQSLKKKAIRGDPTTRDKKIFELKIELTKLESANKNIDQLKRQIETSNNYLNKEVSSIETRLFTTRQMLSRDVEANLDQ
jgi:chromosome segregation ATPase